MLIIPSKQLLLISGQQSKQVFLFDPKTSSVLTKYHTQTSIASTLAYYPQSNQFITSYTNKTFINIWSADCQQSVSKVSTGDILTYLTISHDKNLLYAGSNNGNLYVWQLPTGILLKKISGHSMQIRKIILIEGGYVLTSTRQQIKIWNLSSFFIQTQRSTPIKVINSVLEIIQVQFARNLIIVLTSKSVTHYLCGNEHNHFLQISKQDFQYPTTMCTSLSHLYIGDCQGAIHGQIINTSDNAYELDFAYDQATQQMQIHKNKKMVLKGSSKHPITHLVHLKTLPYLISGNTQGQVSIWQGHILKRSIKLFKGSIKLLSCIPRPSQQKIALSLKLRPLSKFQQNKQTQPIQFNQQTIECGEFNFQKQIQDLTEKANNQLILERMLQIINRPDDMLKEKIQILQQERDLLIQHNMKYCEIWNQDHNTN